jgi:hypothetical protein
MGAMLIIHTTAYAYDFLDYFVLTPGSTWVFNEYDNGVFSEYEGEFLGGYQEVAGGVMAIQRWYPSIDPNTGAWEASDYDLFSTDAQFIYLHGVGDIDGLHTFNPPMAIKRNFVVGETQNLATTVTHPDNSTESVSLSLTLQAIEDVSVPAGTFTNCLKIQISDNGENETSWFANSVGPIKLISGSELQELKSYHIPETEAVKTKAVIVPLAL